MINCSRSTQKELEEWIPPCDDESLRLSGTFNLGINQKLISPFIRQSWLDLISSSNFNKNYELEKSHGICNAIERPERDITLPQRIVIGKYSGIAWKGLNHMTHRSGGLPAGNFAGVNTWVEYGSLHNANGVAEEYEIYNDGNHVIWNLYVENVLKNIGKEIKEPSYYLFGHQLSKNVYDKILEFKSSTGSPLEVAFMAVGSSSTLTEWNVDPTLPLLWQIKLAGGGLPPRENYFSDLLTKRLKDKASFESELGYDFDPDLQASF